MAPLERIPTRIPSDTLIPIGPQRARVLIAEDTPAVAHLIRAMLESAGHEVTGVAVNGLQAVERCLEDLPDVVLMDVEMPECDGIAATEELMARCPTPVVILSAHEDEASVERAAQAGASAYLVKPPTAGDLDRAIQIARARFVDLMALREANEALEERGRELERANEELNRTNKELQDALARVEQLSGLLPICSSCKKIRDDEGAWHQVDAYVTEHSAVEFSHGLCPNCFGELYPQIAAEIEDDRG